MTAAPKPPVRRVLELAATTAAGLVLAASAGCCCLPCGPCGYAGCLPMDAGCGMPAPNSYGADFSTGCAPDCGIPAYAVPGCGAPAGCGDVCETACDGCGVGCQPFPILSGMFRSLKTCFACCACTPCVAACDPYAPTYYCGDAYGHVDGAVYETPAHGPQVYESAPMHAPPAAAPIEYHQPMPAPPADAVPAPVSDPSAHYRGQWRPVQPGGVRPVQYQQVAPRGPAPRPMTRPMTAEPSFMPPPPGPAREVRKPSMQPHPAWQPPRW